MWDGDRIRIDVQARTLDLLVEDEELQRWRAGFDPLPPRYTRGVPAKCARLAIEALSATIAGPAE